MDKLNKKLFVSLKIFLFILLGLTLAGMNVCSTKFGNWMLLKSYCSDSPSVVMVEESLKTEPPQIQQQLHPLIEVDQPLPNSTVISPLTVTGRARGYWYFEASFPVVLKDSTNAVIAQGIAQAQGNWMTEDFVPFVVTLTFTQPPSGSTGTLILNKDNPSGEPQNDDSYSVPVIFGP